MKKKCEVCGETFETQKSQQKFCSVECKLTKRNENSSRWRKNNRDYWQRYNAKRRKKPVKKKCQFCNKTFYTSYSNKIYCSSDCRVQADKLKKAKAYQEMIKQKIKPEQDLRLEPEPKSMPETLSEKEERNLKRRYRYCRKKHNDCSWCEYEDCIYV